MKKLFFLVVAAMMTATSTFAQNSGLGFNYQADPVSARTADVNGDGAVDVADIASVISIMAARARMQAVAGE